MATSAFGEHLRRERELRGIPLEEVCAATRISMRFLEALERGDWRELPGGVFRRGFIRSVSRFLGLDEESMVAEYVQETHDMTQPTATVRVAAIDRRHWLVTAGAASIILLVIALFGYFHIEHRRNSVQHGSLAANSAPYRAIQPELANTKTATSGSNAPTTATNASTGALTGADFAAANTTGGPMSSAPVSTGPYELHMQSTRTTKISVMADGENVFEGTMAAGQWRNFRASKTMHVFAADGAAVLVELNGKPVSTGAPAGQPLNLTYPLPH